MWEPIGQAEVAFEGPANVVAESFEIGNLVRTVHAVPGRELALRPRGPSEDGRVVFSEEPADEVEDVLAFGERTARRQVPIRSRCRLCSSFAVANPASTSFFGSL